MGLSRYLMCNSQVRVMPLQTVAEAPDKAVKYVDLTRTNLKISPRYILDVISQAFITSVYSPQYFDGNCSKFLYRCWEFIVQFCLEAILGHYSLLCLCSPHLIILLSQISFNRKLHIVYSFSLLNIIIIPLFKAFVWLYYHYISKCLRQSLVHTLYKRA